jgi:hypothetical protein
VVTAILDSSQMCVWSRLNTTQGRSIPRDALTEAILGAGSDMIFRRLLSLRNQEIALIENRPSRVNESYIKGCQVRNTPRWNARNILLTSSPVQAAELRCFVLPVVSWFAFMTALFGFLKLTS